MRLAAASALGLAAAAVGFSQTSLAPFTLAERFGVAWPDQPIEFRYDGGAPPLSTTRMIGPAGTEVPYQWVSSCSDRTAVKGCILVLSALPANAAFTWSLQTGAPSAAAPIHPVTVALNGNNWEIANGLTGVRVVSQAANGAPYNLAPIQGILLPGGTWTGVGSSANLLYTEAANGLGPFHTPVETAISYTLQFIDSGPLKTVVQVSYTFARPQYNYGQTVIAPAGAGHYTATFTLYANSKSVLVDEDSDMQFTYYLPIYAQVTPDTARWKGHDALDNTGAADPLCGYDTPLTVRGATNASPIVITASAQPALNGARALISGIAGNPAANGMFYAKTAGYSIGQFALYADPALTQPISGNGDYASGGAVKPAYQGQFGPDPAYDAFQDLTYNSDMPASYLCSPGAAHRKLLTNYPSAEHAAGWYFEFYNSQGSPSSPVVGIYDGDYSTDWYSATGPSMPGPYTSNAHWITGERAAGIQVENLLRGPDASTVPASHNYSVHRNWGIFVSTNTDILPAGSHQPIQNEQNSLTGINLSRLYTYQLDYPDPPGGWTWLYLPASSAAQLIAWVRDGTAICGSVDCYYNLLYNSETSPWGRALLNLWQSDSPAAVQTALDTVTALAGRIVQTLVSGDNHFDDTLGYYQLGLQTSPATAVINAILMDANTSAAQKTTAKAALALFGSLFWDNDWWPIENSTGESVGLSNQIEQYLQYRTQAAATASSQPFLAAQLPAAVASSTSDFLRYFSPTGAAAGSTHYQSTFFEPLILNFMNLSPDGTLSMSDPKWAAYANWELSIQTPPEPRFGNVRKGYSNGDGNTEADVRTGMLATALDAVNPVLAGNLMWAWQQSNSANRLTEDSQFVTTLAVIDPTIPPITPQLGSINVPGYHSVERLAFGTPFETALWFINGGFYSVGGHRHSDDGQVSIYALAAPLAIDWNPNLYSPEVPGRFQHDSIVYDAELSSPWDSDNSSLSAADTLFANPTNTEFGAFGRSATASAQFTSPDGTVWSRTVRTMAFNPTYPILYVADNFTGPSANTGKTLTWNLMAAGAVNTPSGPIAPVTRFSAGCQSPADELPSSGVVYSLSDGLQSFHFTGAPWPAHATGGIDWDLWQLPSSSAAQFFIGNWGHGCQSSRESAEFQATNGVPFEETQHILRVHDTGPFTTLILPYRKTEAPLRSVTEQPCGVQISQGAETTCFNSSAATYTNGTTSILTVYDGSTQTAFGVTASGGPQEIAMEPGQIVWTLSGIAAGVRAVTLPGEWQPNYAITRRGSSFSYVFAGGPQATPVTIVFTRLPSPAKKPAMDR